MGCRVSEREEAAEQGFSIGGAGIDPATEEMALGRASCSEADAFLRAPRGLIEDQRHHLHEQLKEVQRHDPGDKIVKRTLFAAACCAGLLLPSLVQAADRVLLLSLAPTKAALYLSNADGSGEHTLAASTSCTKRWWR